MVGIDFEMASGDSGLINMRIPCVDLVLRASRVLNELHSLLEQRLGSGEVEFLMLIVL